MLLLSRLRGLLKQHSALLLKPFGVQLLSKPATVSALASAEQLCLAGRPVTLASVPDLLRPGRLLFAGQVVATATGRVWRYDNARAQARQLPNGSLLFNRRVPDTDFGTGGVVRDWLLPRRRPVRRVRLLVAPWSHYWTGYYDYLFFVALKLCRIRSVLSAAEWAEAVLCYPLAHTSYERDVLALFGFEPARVLDSRRVDVRFDTCLLGSSDSWAYANEQDLQVFRQLVAAYAARHLPAPAHPPTRLYVRRAGRRRVLNEEALLGLLLPHGFQIVDDVPRSLLEQVQLYRHATFIVGPHGAAFANILWCQPGAHLFELFPATYVPDYFRYLAQVLGLSYSAYCHGEPLGSDHRHVQDDMYVDPAEFERCLALVLAPGK